MNNYILPAEWHTQSCVQLTWPHEDTDWRDYLDDITETFVQIAKAVAHYEPLVIAAKYPERVREVLADSLNDDEMARVSIYECDNNDTWARDHAFITLVPTTDASASCRLLDFRFNGWGEKFAWQKDNAINLQLYYQGAFQAALENHTGFVLEGGSIESDGKGTIFTTSQCLLAPHRNQPFTRMDIEKQLLNFFHAKRIVWLDHGNLVGDDTDGHIDTIVRVAPHDTLLYVGCDDATDEQYADFQALEKQLKSVLTYEGYPYRLLRLPMPDPIYDDGDRLPATYANFLIINGAVIYPTYNQPEKDEEARRQIQLAFPDREIIGVDSCTIIRQHGSIHCLTMQLPEGTIREMKQ